MSRFHYFTDEDLDHAQRLADNIPSKPYKRNPYKIKVDGMSYAEIAAVIGVSKQRVEQIVNRAMAKIRKRYRYSDVDTN